MTSAWGTYGKVWGRFWTEARSAEWSDDMTILGLYLLTSPHHVSEGLYVIPKAYISDDLDWQMERVDETFSLLEKDGFSRYDAKTRVVFLPNALKYQPPVGPKQVKGAFNRVSALPKTVLMQDFLSVADTVCPDLSILYRNTIDTASIPLALCSSSNSKELSVPKLSAPTESEWSERADRVLTTTHFASEYRDLAAILAAGNKTGKVSLRRVVTTLYDPLLAVENNGVGEDAFEYGLRAAIAKGAPNPNYVKKAAVNYDPSRVRVEPKQKKTIYCPKDGVEMVPDGDGTSNLHCPVCS